MTDKERKMALKRLRAENQEFKKALRWMRYFEYRKPFQWSMSKETFETLQRLVGGPVEYSDSVINTAEGNGKV